ncbi:adhesive plaque matrix protein-like [Dreissena polymorpha]|uniref:adhesive plaque matrix protein-like n=1 Tax=Dreissena polymorpha TaxID=45954 RepID=UPI0022645F20|nr:adhesive plaque matrix protein-like [Dreissena polymorpha]
MMFSTVTICLLVSCCSTALGQWGGGNFWDYWKPTQKYQPYQPTQPSYPAYPTKPPVYQTKPPVYATQPPYYATKPPVYTTKPPVYSSYDPYDPCDDVYCTAVYCRYGQYTPTGDCCPKCKDPPRYGGGGSNYGYWPYNRGK